MNSVELIGRISTEVELKHTNSGVSVLSFNLAVNRPKDKKGNEIADFLPCVIWREYAAVMSRCLTKGQQIGIKGRLRSRSYEDKEGKKRTAIEVIVDEVTLLGKKDDNKAKTEKAENSQSAEQFDADIPDDYDGLSLEPIPDFEPPIGE